MSTDHQSFSIENQTEVIRRYAAQHGMEIVRTYTDAGRSGLNIERRAGLQQLLADVRSGSADFSDILVYDISRWGRFQDSDEPAAYEYACRAKGIRVAYCAEEFENDGSIGSDLQKVVKRRMAAEYSRELSVKVWAGQCRLIELGYRQGGEAGFGLRRLLIDEKGVPKGVLARNQRKNIQTDRVVLVPGPAKERAIVTEIYEAFVHEGLRETQIAARLNKRGLLTDLGRAWTRAIVHQILISEKYIGNNVWNRTSYKLKQCEVQNTPDLWIRADDVLPAIVERSLFDAAQKILFVRSHRLTDDDLLQLLRDLLQSKGYLSQFVVDRAPQCPSSGVYRRRFGTLRRAFQLIGYVSDWNCGYVVIKHTLRRLRPDVIAGIIEGFQRAGGEITRDRSDLLVVNGEFSVSVVLVGCRETRGGCMRWTIRLDSRAPADLTIAVRMNRSNTAAHDYLILPTMTMDSDVMHVAEHNGIALDSYLFDSLDPLFAMAGRVSLMEAH